jgi:F-type H+-transporting ATPase subunit delta
MAELSTVARPYAEALFSAALDDKSSDLQAWVGAVNEMASVVSQADVREAMTDPRLGDEAREQVFRALLRSTLPDHAGNFIDLLVQNDRLILLPEIAEQFEELKNRHEGTALADITSAFELNEEQVRDLVGALELKFGLKLKARVTVDPELIGGVRVAVGDQVLDTSVQAQLARMRDTLEA